MTTPTATPQSPAIALETASSGNEVSAASADLPETNTPPADVALAERLFAELAERTADTEGVTRPSYGLGEQIAHDMMRREARKLGLAVASDAGCNLYVTLTGREPGPGIMIGSHLDSVPLGGNYDGAAGVLMGLAVVSGFVKAGITPRRDITVMAIRAEESAWFGASYVGSRAAFGKLSKGELNSLTRATDRVRFASAIDAAGGDSARLRAGEAYLKAENIGCFIEPHIEQGPVLVDRTYPVGVVTGIRGAFRFRKAACHGKYAHSGATPDESRSDAVRATAKLVVQLDQARKRVTADGADLIVTFCEFATDPNEAAFSKVAGEVNFSLDVRSQERDTLDRFLQIVLDEAAAIEREDMVSFDFGKVTRSTPALMDEKIISALQDHAESHGIDALTMACGAGHDAATFAGQGVPTGMIFIRNDHGSHNPDEHMEIADFAEAATLLSAFCLTWNPS